MKIYYGLVHKDADSAYGISFPDLPGCFAASDEETDILEAAQTALVLYAQDGEVLADPRSFPELQSDSTVKVELAQGAVMVAVPLISVERKARYNVMLDVDLVAGMDRQAKVAGTSRSDFLADAVKDKLRSSVGAAIVSLAGGWKSESTGKKTASTASKVLHSKTATKDEKSVAASALAQTKTKDVTSKAFASKAGKILHDPKASKEAKSAAASALTQAAAHKKPATKKK